VSDLKTELAGRVVIVTAAGGSIGSACALALARCGASLALNDIDAAALAGTCEKVEALGVRAVPLVGDVGDYEAVQSMAATACAELGGVFGLVNIAGAAMPRPILDMSPGDWARTWNVNVTSLFNWAHAVLPRMLESPHGGRIVNNGSISAHVPRPNSAPYTATKHAITGLTRSTSLDGRKYNIACGQIDIGNASTEMTRRMQTGVPQADGSMEVEPTIDVDHIARSVLYMANLPLDVNVQFMTVMATKMPFIGRG